MNAEAVETYLRGLHQRIRDAFEADDGLGRFLVDQWQRPTTASALGGGGVTCVLERGAVFERAGCNFSDVTGHALPPSATARNPELAGRPYRAMGVSVVVHPVNPFVPTSHLNVRFFHSGQVWWFGGGFDLTPYYPVEEDVRHWHAVARQAAGTPGRYAEYKQRCDEYFYLKHRGEMRGVGGLFVDDLSGDFDDAFALIRRIGDGYLDAYRPIVERRKQTPYQQRHREFQAWRRGRYVEFNLVYDRGTLFGLQSGGRAEAILVSMPPSATWKYEWSPEPGSEEAALASYLTPRDW